MDVELLVVPDCPNEVPARDLARAALEGLGIPASITTSVIHTEEEAQARGFVGSPSFCVDGRDLFPRPEAAVGVACRVYATRAGLRGVPSLEDLREALRRAATA